MKRTKPVVSRLTAAGACVGVALAATAADQPSTAGSTATGAVATSGSASAKAAPAPLLKKPAWLTDLSLSVKEGYDDNLLGVSGATDTSMPRESSFYTTISPKIGFNFAPLLGDQKTLQTLSLGYAPDFVLYYDEPAEPLDSRESYNLHRITDTIKGKVEDFSFNLDNAFSYVDGSKEGPTYPGLDSGRSAYSTGMPRERREQIQDRAKAVFQYDLEKWFVRASASLLYYDYMTRQRALAGYQNYADRYDVNGGPDLGYRINKNLAVLLGYRYGHQQQETYSPAVDPLQLSATSDYHRVLLGLEGKPWKWLTLSLQGGPDFRRYQGNEMDGATVVHSMPVGDRDTVTYYGEGSATAQLSPKDALTAKYRAFRWMSSTGKIPYFDSSYELAYARKLTSKLSLDLGGRIGSGNYTCANTGGAGPTGASWQRDDWMYTASVGLAYTFTSNLSVNAAYSHDWGRNNQDGLAAPQYRDFTRSLVSLGAQFKF